MAIEYLRGDATAALGSGSRILVHVCNDVGKWGKGFVLAISRRWNLPELQFKAWFRGETGQPFALGEVQFGLSFLRLLNYTIRSREGRILVERAG